MLTSIYEAANKELGPVLQSLQLEQSKLNDELAASQSLLDQEISALEELKSAREEVAKYASKVYKRQKLTNEETERMVELLKGLGITVTKTKTGFFGMGRELINTRKAFEDLDAIISGHELTKDELSNSIMEIENLVVDLNTRINMSETEWQSFWSNISQVAATRGRSMLTILGQLAGAMERLDYVTGATNREIQRLDLRYRENELMIREIEKGMRKGSISYREGAAQIRALRKENEDLALARDEARLEQDKINLAMEEATATIDAYQYQIDNLTKKKQALLKEMLDLEEIMRSGATLTDEQRARYEELQEEIAGTDAKLDDLGKRLDTIKDKFPAIEEASLNLRKAIREFAGELSQVFIGPIDDLDLVTEELDYLSTTDFSTEFDFLYDPTDWQPVYDALNELQDTDWEAYFKVIIDSGDLDEILRKLKELDRKQKTKDDVTEEEEIPSVIEDLGDALEDLDDTTGIDEKMYRVGSVGLDAMKNLKEAAKGLGNVGDWLKEGIKSFKENVWEKPSPLHYWYEGFGAKQIAKEEALISSTKKPAEIVTKEVNVTMDVTIKDEGQTAREIAEDLANEIYLAEQRDVW